ncbi:MAG: SHOCT domain-containing protein [Burkholderiales bacterium]|nr:SHOCT domain-containing protein [Burkholderiales bacterium]
MTIAALRKTSLSVGACVVIGSALLAPLAASAFQADSSTGRSVTESPVRGATGRQLWRLSDYTTIELVAREAGAADNQHPYLAEPNTLHAWLQQIQVVRGGAAKPLFAIDELNNILPSLVEALAHARPDQDVAVVSAARHEDNTFFSISAVTARLFAVDGHLNIIVHDSRFDFYDTARGSGMAPHFTVGSRTVEGSAPIQSASATNKRFDWLVLGTAAPAPAAPMAPAPVAPAAPAASPAPVPPVAPPAPAAPAAAPVPQAAPAPAAAPPAPPAEQDAEQRLTKLKRLYDKGLITKSEYDKKRAEIIKGL